MSLYRGIKASLRTKGICNISSVSVIECVRERGFVVTVSVCEFERLDIVVVVSEL